MTMERRSVKDLLVMAKDEAELIVDLAYAAVFFDDRDLAAEVFRLEVGIGEVIDELRMICLMAARTRQDAEGLAGVLALASSIETIADSAEDIAQVVMRGLGVPSQLRDDLWHAEEVVARLEVREGSPMAGIPLRELGLPAGTGMWLIAIRRGEGWIFGPGGGETPRQNDMLFVQGPREGVDLVGRLAGLPPRDQPIPKTPSSLSPPDRTILSHLDRAVDLVVELKNTSEMAVGLAYSAILLRDRRLAQEVAALEEVSDGLHDELEGWVLRAAAELENPEELRGLIHISAASERIVDAARAMTRLVEVEVPPHPIIARALAEAEEVVVEARVEEGSAAVDRSLGELRLHLEAGMEVMAIHRHGRWVHRPRPPRILEPGDRLLALGPAEGAVRLRVLCGDRRPVGEGGWAEPEDAV